MATAEQLKILVSDPPTPSGTQILPDTTYELIASLEPNLYKAAGNAARSLASFFFFAQKVTVTAGPVKIESSHKCEHYIKIAKQFAELSKTFGYVEPGSSDPPLPLGAPVSGGVVTGIDISEMEEIKSDPNRYKSVFYRGLDESNNSEDLGDGV